MLFLEMLFVHEFLFCEHCGAKIYRAEVLPTNYQELFKKHQTALEFLSQPHDDIRNFSDLNDFADSNEPNADSNQVERKK